MKIDVLSRLIFPVDEVETAIFEALFLKVTVPAELSDAVVLNPLFLIKQFVNPRAPVALMA